MMDWAPNMMVFIPEEQTLLTVVQMVDQGRPERPNSVNNHKTTSQQAATQQENSVHTCSDRSLSCRCLPNIRAANISHQHFLHIICLQFYTKNISDDANKRHESQTISYLLF